MQKQEELVAYWLKSARYDLSVAEHLFEKGDYAYCLFFGHLLVEKTLKAIYVQRTGPNPPYKHNLPLLAEKAKVPLTDEQTSFLEEVSDFNLEARYPDYKFSFYQKCDKAFTKEYFERIKELVQWLETLLQ